jgi:hypothetical protein
MMPNHKPQHATWVQQMFCDAAVQQRQSRELPMYSQSSFYENSQYSI